ncbi:hypothetical protein [Botrimarina sp.]|uniref:hypothetical protein n=1 Tax=Botrimarina sp. TaxID=2795802 RepID=UPI0032EFE31F
MDDPPELTAYHEAGHALIAAYAGGRVTLVTIAPEPDDGPRRFGGLEVVWRRGEFSPKALAEKLVLVALAGPVAEMLYRGEPLHPALVGEWSADWRQAWDEAAAIVPDERRRTRWLEDRLRGLYGLLDEPLAWEAVAGVADHLMAHETLEREEFAELVSVWLG